MRRWLGKVLFQTGVVPRSFRSDELVSGLLLRCARAHNGRAGAPVFTPSDGLQQACLSLNVYFQEQLRDVSVVH